MAFQSDTKYCLCRPHALQLFKIQMESDERPADINGCSLIKFVTIHIEMCEMGETFREEKTL